MSQVLFRLLGPASRHQKSVSSLVIRACLASSNAIRQPTEATFSDVSLYTHETKQRYFSSTRTALKSGSPRVFESFGDEEAEANEADDKAVDEEFLSILNPLWVEKGLSPVIIRMLAKKGFSEFTPVQAEAFEPVMAGRDVIGRSRTGTGKTLAFGLPAMTRIVELTTEKGTRDKNGRMARGRKPSMLILCPTRELARQVGDELTIYADPLGLDVACFHGGVSYNPQTDALYGGLDILVGTPGRVYDHINSGALNLGECDIAVLDEADQMLNMGFAEQVEQIFENMGKANDTKTQCLFFSATTPDWLKKIGKKYQSNVFSIDSTGDEGGARVAKTVRHMAVEVPEGDIRTLLLEDIIRAELDFDGDGSKKKAMIFTNTKREADALAMSGTFKTLVAKALHGDHSQNQRDVTLDQFRTGRFNVLVATDVAARGIDIKEVDLVVQMGPPTSADAYVHRSGRTGRAGAKGTSILIYSRQQKWDIQSIERDLGHAFRFELKKPPSHEEIMAMSAKGSITKINAVSPSAMATFKSIADELLASHPDPSDLVARCLAVMNARAVSHAYTPEPSTGFERSHDRHQGRTQGRERHSHSRHETRSRFGGVGGRGRPEHSSRPRNTDSFGSRSRSSDSFSPRFDSRKSSGGKSRDDDLFGLGF